MNCGGRGTRSLLRSEFSGDIALNLLNDEVDLGISESLAREWGAMSCYLTYLLDSLKFQTCFTRAGEHTSIMDTGPWALSSLLTG
jgi:hypothetical protein